MNITLQDAGKRFNREWVFRNLNFSFSSGNAYAITGVNGSGKSTLLQVIAGAISLNEGEMIIEQGTRSKEQGENFYQNISITAPYVEVIEEMTAKEFLLFHQNFKPLLSDIAIPQIISIIELESAANKQIRFYSSGMKQRIKLAQAIFSSAPVLLLDEPCTNLDENGFVLYRKLIEKYCSDKLIIVSSNDTNEYGFCDKKIEMSDYKKW